ncbi:uncharacterized protein [Branchiostoma lanceolatum]|uniref:uncharacterized protein n=1 Tax=Branchiostoma lanceolatum TaxID=7740 RepID=UPI0034548C99
MNVWPVVLLWLLLLAMDPSDAECCDHTKKVCTVRWLFFKTGCTKYCGDGTEPTPCCGHGKCNIFCCNCDGGCRGKKRTLGEEFLPPLVFEEYDADGDQRLSVEEAAVLLEALEIDVSSLPADWFTSVDSNGNGYIEADEFDKGMTPAKKYQ